MGNRERVLDSIAAWVERAAETLADVSEAGTEVRLQTIIDGWGRGLAAGMEELAIGLDEVQRLLADAAAERDAGEPTASPEIDSRSDTGADEEDAAPDHAPLPSEEESRTRALESLEATRAVRDETHPSGEDGGESRAAAGDTAPEAP